MDVVDVNGWLYDVEVYEQRETVFDVKLGYARIEGVVWVCRSEGYGMWRAVGRKEVA